MAAKSLLSFGSLLAFCWVAAVAWGDPPAYLGDADVPLPKGAKMRLMHLGQNCAVAFSPDGKVLASGGNDIWLWDTSTWKELRCLQQPRVQALAFASPEGKILAAGSDRHQTVLWDAARGVLLHKLGTRSVSSLAFSPDGKMLATAEGGGVNDRPKFSLWHPGTGKQIRVLDENQKGALFAGVAFSSGGKVLATGAAYGGRIIRLWDSATGKQLSQFPGEPAERTTIRRPLAFSPDGKTLAVGGDGGTMLWDLSGPKPRAKEFPKLPEKQARMWAEHDKGGMRVQSLAFSPDGTLLAVLQIRATWPYKKDNYWDELLLVETATGRVRNKHQPKGGVVGGAVAFAPNEKTLVSTHLDEILVWDLPSAK
jgi:WD40 repeat protein